MDRQQLVEQARQVVDPQHVRTVDSGRPSASVRSGSSCISMKSASTPNATAARASAGTYLRSRPSDLPRRR